MKTGINEHQTGERNVVYAKNTSVEYYIIERHTVFFGD